MEVQGFKHTASPVIVTQRNTESAQGRSEGVRHEIRTISTVVRSANLSIPTHSLEALMAIFIMKRLLWAIKISS